MPRIKRRGHAASMLDARQTFELLLGPITEGAFANERERRSAWFRYRDELLAETNEFSRPWAFWAFEIGRVPSPANGDRESALLSELGLLTDRERAMLTGDSLIASMLNARRKILRETQSNVLPMAAN